jgi:DNA-binding CsgD family transcriptional regulator
MDRPSDSLPKRSGTLVFDLKCRLLCSNDDGRLLYMGEGNAPLAQASPDMAFDIKRLCFRLKKLADAMATDGATVDEPRVPPIVVTSSDQRYRLEGSLLVDEITNHPCLLVKVKNEESKKPGKLDLSHYQSLYGLTRRETQILDLLSKGASYKEISYTLTISFHTVRDHVKHIRFKLHTDGKFGILARLIEEGSVYEETETVVTGSGDLVDEPAPLAEQTSGHSGAGVVDPRDAVAGKSRLAMSTQAPATSGKHPRSAPTRTNGGTPPGKATVRTPASYRPATKRDLHSKGKP